VAPEPGEGVEQLAELHDELVCERQAKKIYPDCEFEKECEQQDYNALKDIASEGGHASC
jgi:hypothetical protein